MPVGLGLAGARVGPGLAQGGGTVALPWYRAGGAPAPMGAWQAKGAASYAASKSNLANPGTYDLVDGTAYPTWAAATGWTFNGSRYLKTGLCPNGNQTWTMLVRYASVTNQPIVAGVYLDSPAYRFEMGPYWGGNDYWQHNGAYYNEASVRTTAGVLAIAGRTCYRNGASVYTLAAVSVATQTQDVWLGCRNYNGSVNTGLAGAILAAVIYDTSTDHATWLPAVSTAMAAL